MGSDRIPRHVAVIMDGNGRWAEGRSKPRYAGHRAGIGPVRQTVEHAARRGVSTLTLFAFSSENWGRPHDEVSRLMGLFHEALQREIDELHANRVRLRFIGDRSMLRRGLCERIAGAEERTSANDGLTLNIAVAYGGRWDITNAARLLAERVERGELKAVDIDETTWREWKVSRSDLSPIITRAEAVIYQQKFTGAAADLLNPNIIARTYFSGGEPKLSTVSLYRRSE